MHKILVLYYVFSITFVKPENVLCCMRFPNVCVICLSNTYDTQTNFGCVTWVFQTHVWDIHFLAHALHVCDVAYKRICVMHSFHVRQATSLLRMCKTSYPCLAYTWHFNPRMRQSQLAINILKLYRAFVNIYIVYVRTIVEDKIVFKLTR